MKWTSFFILPIFLFSTEVFASRLKCFQSLKKMNPNSASGLWVEIQGQQYLALPSNLRNQRGVFLYSQSRIYYARIQGNEFTRKDKNGAHHYYMKIVLPGKEKTFLNYVETPRRNEDGEVIEVTRSVQSLGYPNLAKTYTAGENYGENRVLDQAIDQMVEKVEEDHLGPVHRLIARTKRMEMSVIRFHQQRADLETEIREARRIIAEMENDPEVDQLTLDLREADLHGFLALSKDLAKASRIIREPLTEAQQDLQLARNQARQTTQKPVFQEALSSCRSLEVGNSLVELAEQMNSFENGRAPAVEGPRRTGAATAR